MMGKRIIITGATGLIGKNIIPILQKKGYEITIFTRNAKSAKNILNSDKIEYVSWDYTKTSDEIIKYLEGSYSIINLAGASIGGKRWSPEYKRLIFDSRIITTEKITEAISKCVQKPEIFISSSAIGYYGMHGEENADEESKSGNDFLAELCIKWEKKVLEAEKYGVRAVVMRTGIVLDEKEGALAKLITPFKLFAGGCQGNGKQWVSWIHIDDLVNLYMFAIENNNIKGAVNATAPNPVTNKDYCREIGKVLGRPAILPLPGFMLKIILGEFADYVLTGKKVLPKKAEENGFRFKFEYIEKALINILKK